MNSYLAEKASGIILRDLAKKMQSCLLVTARKWLAKLCLLLFPTIGALAC